MVSQEHIEIAQQIVDEAELEPEAPDHAPEIFDALPQDFDDRVIRRATDIALCGEVIYSVNDDPEIVAASSVYLACLLESVSVTQQEIADTVDFSTGTIGINYQEIFAHTPFSDEERELPLVFQVLSSPSPDDREDEDQQADDGENAPQSVESEEGEEEGGAGGGENEEQEVEQWNIEGEDEEVTTSQLEKTNTSNTSSTTNSLQTRDPMQIAFSLCILTMMGVYAALSGLWPIVIASGVVAITAFVPLKSLRTVDYDFS